MLCIPDGMRSSAIDPIVKNLNGPNAPDFHSIVNEKYDRLPKEGWKPSWGRISPLPLTGDTALLTNLVVNAFDEYERCCLSLTQGSDLLYYDAFVIPALQGVPSPVLKHYLSGKLTAPWGVRRLDVSIDKDGNPLVWETDEHPGGVADAYALDMAYGVNQTRWKLAIASLTKRGKLIFVVSSKWSSVYVQEMRWLAEQWDKVGAGSVAMVTTDELDQLQVGHDGQLYHRVSDGPRHKVGTIWRLFPLFEIDQRLMDLVDMASAGTIAMVPEVAPWGNKAWLGIFWELHDYFRQHMSNASFELLQKTIPPSSLVRSQRDFPQTVGMCTIASYEELRQLGGQARNNLVLKVAGATEQSTRSYGVYLGKTFTNTRWPEQVDKAFAAGAPVLLQQYRAPATYTIPVWSVLNELGRLQPEDFNCRVLLRPWYINGMLVSCPVLACPTNMSKTHGCVDAAQIPLDLG
ncbi:MAG TPA: hypothetical protein VNG90_03675 [Candidatus Acidoferrum sp.]|nr:hypothetical protein [Candidatus Acidoferrum sp.]